MQSSPGASFLRRSAVAVSFTLLVLCRAGSARAADAEPNVAAPDSPPSAEPAPLAAIEDRVILIVRTRGDDELMLRLLAELRESEWRILEVRPDERFAPAPLGTVAERERAGAAVRLDARRGLVELWILRPDGPVEETIAAPTPPNDQVLALRVTETLRARGLLVVGEKHAEVPETEPSAPKPERAPEAPPPKRKEPEKESHVPLSFELGPGFAVSPGGLGPLAVLEGGVRLEFLDLVSASAVGFFPLSHQTVEGAEGRAEVRTSFVGGILELEWARLSFGGFRSGIGATAAITSMSGRAAGGRFATSEDTVTTFAPLGRTSFHVVLGPSFRVRTAVVVGATFPEVGVEFGSRSVATFGQPFALFSLALEVSPFH